MQEREIRKGNAYRVRRTTEFQNALLPVMFLAQKLVDVIIHVSDFEFVEGL